jgi:hypothetical protein
MEALYTFKHTILVRLNTSQRVEAEKILNLHHIHSETCNYIDENGVIVGKEHENMKKLEDSHWRMNTTQGVEVLFDMFEDGSFGNFRKA